MKHSIQADNLARKSRAGAPTIDLSLNNGNYCSERCLEVLRAYSSSSSLRIYPAADNRDVREALAEDAGVGMEHIFVANGSGPLLKTCIPFVIERQIKASISRIARHVLFKSGYPIIAPRFTYSKVPTSAMKLGLTTSLLPLEPDNDFRLSLSELTARLDRGDGLVYLCNPNNPTGNVLITREQLEPLLTRYPHTTFVIDEAYAQYIPQSRYQYMSDLVPAHPNLMVMRSFSFAYGLAAVRIGYVVARPELVKGFEAKTTPHQLGQLSAEIAMAALADREHLSYVQRHTAAQRARIITGLRRYDGLKVYDSEANFILCRMTDGRSGKDVATGMLERGVKIKTFEPLPDFRFDEYFRITVGLDEENDYLLQQIEGVLGG